jgi:TatA/E family protein of Tat protein translocase
VSNPNPAVDVDVEKELMPQIGPAEILVIVLVGLLVFGPTRLPEIGRQVGRAMHEVKKFQAVVRAELDRVVTPHEES